MADHSMMKLGRKAVKRDTRTLQLARYFTSALPAPPDLVDWAGTTTSWGMFLNDSLGDCTCAGVAHQDMVWQLASSGVLPDFTNAEVLDIYEKWCGYVPGNPNTDQGGVELDILNDWRSQGFAGRKILAYADAKVDNVDEVKQACWLFGGLYIGINLPISAQTQDVWDVSDGPDGEPGTWGGHCVTITGYDADGLTCITWGQLKKMTWAFWRTYVDEAHAILSPDWIAAAGTALSGFNLDQLRSDLALIH